MEGEKSWKVWEASQVESVLEQEIGSRISAWRAGYRVNVTDQACYEIVGV